MEWVSAGTEEQAAKRFAAWLEALPKGKRTRLHILCDSDCDGLPAGALMMRGLALAGFDAVSIEPKRKGESAWLPEVLQRMAEREPEGLIVLDLGSRPDAMLPGVPTVLIDHHLPGGVPPGAELITSYGVDPTAVTGLMVYWCLRDVISSAERDALLWMPALSLLSDLGDKAPFAELAEAKKRWSASSMREAVTLLNAPRRTALADASGGLDLLLRCSGPKEVVAGAEAAGLRAAKEEVSAALLAAKKAAPKFSKKWRERLGADLVALRMDSPCQVHPLVAQTWRARFKDSIVMGVNFGFRPGYVHFSARGPKGVNVIRFLREHAPPGVDQGYGNGHDQASGGAVPVNSWNLFVEDLGFGPEMMMSDQHLSDNAVTMAHDGDAV